MRSFKLVLTTLLLAGTALAQQQPGFGERVDVNAVLLDAVVTDSRGNQILGLTKDDFIVTEDGVQQTIDSVDYLSSRQLLTDNEASAPFNVERSKEQRYFVFFLDKVPGGSLFGRLASFRRAAVDFIAKEVGADDLVAVVGHDVRLNIYSDFTTDKRAISRAFDDAMKFSRGISEAPASGPSILRSIDKDRMMAETGTTYQALELLGDGLRPIRARKNLVLVSPLVYERGEEVRGGVLLSTSRYYEPMIEALNAANVTVFAMNLLQNAPSDPVYHQTLERIARETNGEYFRYATSFRTPLRELAKASGGYYLITYRTERKAGQTGFQRVDVKVKQPELRVKARAGYAYGG
ncbi:MAG TPA: VWA domain-containing protein [Thermoanaerobaculia bacterium]|nr:VWA domain-containing protein [Thermoanaerobaculia bacterium]